MSIPGLSLPGLSLANTTYEAPEPTIEPPRHHDLLPETEFRFESSFTSAVTIKITSGNAELFGTELAPNTIYTFKGTKAAIFTWQGCRLEVTGNTEGEYVAEETPMVQYSNAHFALENARADAERKNGLGPRVLIVGPENAGKTSLVKTLTAYAVKSGRQPVVVNLDPQQALLGVPGALAASTFASLLDVEEGWGSSPISGPSTLPVAMPLCYQFGCQSAEGNEKLFKAIVTRLALAVTSRMGEDMDVKTSGFFIDTPGSISSGKGSNYELIQHIVSEFSVNAILVVGGERLFSEMKRLFATASASNDAVTVVRLDKSGGCVDREETYMRALRQQQIREYFFGHGSVNLSPLTTTVDYNQLSIYRIIDSRSNSFDPGADDDDDDGYEPYNPQISAANSSIKIFEKVTPSLMLQNSLLAIVHAEPNDSLDNIRDASVMGYVYVAEVEESKRKVRLLSPVGGRVPSKAMVWGNWPEVVVDLVG